MEFNLAETESIRFAFAHAVCNVTWCRWCKYLSAVSLVYHHYFDAFCRVNMATWTVCSSHLDHARLRLLASALSDMIESSLLNPSRSGFYTLRLDFYFLPYFMFRWEAWLSYTDVVSFYSSEHPVHDLDYTLRSGRLPTCLANRKIMMISHYVAAKLLL